MSHAIVCLAIAASVLILSASHAIAETGTASWYGWREDGNAMASGKAFHALGTNAASRTLPLGTHVRVTDLATGRHADVVIEDRGPYVRGRIIDLSLGTARELGIERQGLARVRVDVVEPGARIRVVAQNVRHRGKKKRKVVT